MPRSTLRIRPRCPGPAHIGPNSNDVAEKLDWAKRHALDEVKPLQELHRLIQNTDESETRPPSLTTGALLAEDLQSIFELLTGHHGAPWCGPQRAATLLRQPPGLWADRFSRSPAETLPAARTLEHWQGVCLKNIKPNCRPGTFRAVAHPGSSEVSDFQADGEQVTHPQMDPARINEATLNKIYLHFAKLVNEGKIQPGTANAKLIVLRRFVRFLHAQRQIDELPRNIMEKSMKFKNPAKRIKVPKLEWVLEVLRELPDKEKLFALLALNAGMNQVDLSDLRNEQVDWVKGTLTRRRVKTGEHKNVPTVTYLLWPETLRLLQQHRSEDREDSAHVLLTSKGTTLVERFERNGKTCKKDNITLRGSG